MLKSVYTPDRIKIHTLIQVSCYIFLFKVFTKRDKENEKLIADLVVSEPRETLSLEDFCQTKECGSMFSWFEMGKIFQK